MTLTVFSETKICNLRFYQKRPFSQYRYIGLLHKIFRCKNVEYLFFAVSCQIVNKIWNLLITSNLNLHINMNDFFAFRNFLNFRLRLFIERNLWVSTEGLLRSFPRADGGGAQKICLWGGLRTTLVILLYDPN